jgi:hypothetical protein
VTAVQGNAGHHGPAVAYRASERLICRVVVNTAAPSAILT